MKKLLIAAAFILADGRLLAQNVDEAARLKLNFPAAGWHRGDVSVAQENSLKAIERALQSFSPNIEVDLIHFIDEKGDTVGLLAHEYEMKRTTGMKGKFFDQKDFVLVQDDIVFSQPALIEYWRNVRKVKFVGVFVYEKERGYTDAEWQILKKADWLELDPLQMRQREERKTIR